MRNYASLVKTCESLIREGRPQDVHKLISTVNSAKVPRELRLPLANICRRVGLYSFGLMILSPLVDERKGKATATGQERAEHAMLLMRGGAVNEALMRLEKIDPKQVPATLLYRSFSHFLRWEFEEAVPLLQQYVSHPPSSYAALVGMINLACARIECGQFDLARDLLEQVLETSAREKHIHLERSGISFLAQMYILQGSFAQARSALERVGQVKDQKVLTHDQFEIVKWFLILDGLENKSLRAFENLRDLSRKNREWESLREADLFLLRVDFSKERLLHLYFGTPFPAFRMRLAREFGAQARDTYVLGRKQDPRFDLRTGLIEDRPLLNPGRMPHRLLDVLLYDFYQKPTVVGLFHELFPGEYFDVASSPDRVHQLIRRTRRWIEDQKIPLAIDEFHGFYELKRTGPISFRIPLQRKLIDSNQLHLTYLREAFRKKQNFSAAEVMKSLTLSKATTYRFLNWGLKSGYLAPLDADQRPMRYRLAAA